MLSRAKLDWPCLEKFAGDFKTALSQGIPRRLALQNACLQCRVAEVQRLAPLIQYSAPLLSDVFKGLTGVCKEANLRVVFEGVFSVALTPGVSRHATESALQYLQNIASAQRTMAKQTAQARAQAIFLTALVPTVFIFLLVCRWNEIFGQLLTSYGRFVFALAISFYCVGVILLRWLTSTSVLTLSSGSLSSLEGQMALVQRVIAHKIAGTTAQQSVSAGLLTCENVELKKLGNAMSWCFCPSPREKQKPFLAMLQSGFQRATHPRMPWILELQTSLFERLQLLAADRAAAMSLKLLLPLALFFLPALFLMLCLSGSVQSPVTLGAD
ncbi:hypothetical protein EBU99_03235 [bacterium]|nr:hypothetical protein [bacterium]